MDISGRRVRRPGRIGGGGSLRGRGRRSTSSSGGVQSRSLLSLHHSFFFLPTFSFGSFVTERFNLKKSSVVYAGRLVPFVSVHLQHKNIVRGGGDLTVITARTYLNVQRNTLDPFLRREIRGEATNGHIDKSRTLGEGIPSDQDRVVGQLLRRA